MIPEPTLDDAPAGYDNQEASAWLMGFERASGLIEDQQRILVRREQDCERVKEKLIPLLASVSPFDDALGSDHDTLRAGYVAELAAELIHDQQEQIERLRADVSFRSGVTLTVQRELEFMQSQRDAALAEVEELKVQRTDLIHKGGYKG